jgi:hypothetical protein
VFRVPVDAEEAGVALREPDDVVPCSRRHPKVVVGQPARQVRD